MSLHFSVVAEVDLAKVKFPYALGSIISVSWHGLGALWLPQVYTGVTNFQSVCAGIKCLWGTQP